MQFKQAKRTDVNLLIGLAGGTGSGKTYTALRLAKGIAGTKRFCLIDTEAGRALHYADQFDFDHGDLAPPFTPMAYQDAIMAADAAGYPVIVVDSASHEWSGDGGCLDWQEAELDRMAGDDWKKREACKMAAWIRPKMAHKHMVARMLQVRAHLILCFRAEPKVEMVKEGGKWEIRPKQSLTGLDGWIPVSEKNLPFELTASFLLTAEAPGIPKPIKLQEQHRAMFPIDKPITEESGERIARWASGGSTATQKGFDNDKLLGAFGPLGQTIESITQHLGHPPSESDKPELDRWYRELKRAAVHRDQSGSGQQGQGSGPASGQIVPATN